MRNRYSNPVEVRNRYDIFSDHNYSNEINENVKEMNMNVDKKIKRMKAKYKNTKEKFNIEYITASMLVSILVMHKAETKD